MSVIVRGSTAGTAWPRVTRSIVTPSSGLAITLVEAKASIRVDTTDEDTVLTDYIKAATAKVETDTGVALLTQTIDFTFEGFPAGYGPLDLPVEPIQSVTHVKYTDADAVLQTVDAATYIVNGSRIGLIDTAAWDTDLRGFAPVVVRVVAGYPSTALIPADLRMAVRLVFGWLAAHREPAQWEQAVYEGWVSGHKRTLVS